MTDLHAAEDIEAPAATEPADGVPAKRRGRWTRRIGTTLVVLGALLLAYGASVYFWRDPVTDLYARWKQHELAGQLDAIFSEYRAEPTPPPAEETAPPNDPSPPIDAADPAQPSPTAIPTTIERAAQRMFDRLEPGQAVGRIVIPKLDIHPVFVNGTRWGADLSRGPGRYEQTSLPGLGDVTAIAGHRTTFGAPFRHIDRLAPGDTVTLELPYGTFHYAVIRHEIVDNNDWSIIDPTGYDELVLSACHPLYSASHRYVVFARLTSIQTRDGATYTVPTTS